MIEFDVKIDETDYLNRKSEIWAGKKIIHRGKAALKTDWSEGAEKDTVRTEDCRNSQAV